MQIEVIGGNTVKIVLNELDMSDYDICFERLSCKDPETKRLLVELLALVRAQKNIDLCTEKLYIEAFPRSDGGCMLYISPLTDNAVHAVKPKGSPYTGVICECASLDAMLALGSQLYTRYSHVLHDSQLYMLNGRYRLILYTFNRLEERLSATIREFSKIVGRGDIHCARTAETHKCIIPKNAVTVIALQLA